MAYTPRPHISAALQHLRFGITAACAVLALALIVQVLCWMTLHFGDITTTELEPPAGESTTLVVEGSSTPEELTPTESGPTETINTVPTGTGLFVRRATDVSHIVGIIAAVLLTVLMLQSVAVAGGGGVPGVEMVVTATTWALILAALVMPWSTLVPATSFGGVLEPWAAMMRTSADVRDGAPGSPGGVVYLGLRLVLPLAMLGGVAAIWFRFRAGVERGIIVTHASQLDAKLEAEIRSRRVGEMSTPRSVGALNAAIGESGGVEVEAPAPAPPAQSPPPPMSARHPASPPIAAPPSPPAGSEPMKRRPI